MDTSELEKLLKQDEATVKKIRLSQRDKGLHYPRRLKIKVKKLIENNRQQVLENIKPRSVNHFLPGCAEFYTCDCLKLQALGINTFDELTHLLNAEKVIQ